MYAESAGERLKLHGRREARRVEIGALKKVGEWPPQSERGRLQKSHDFLYRHAEHVERMSQRSAEERDEQRARAKAAEASVAALTDEKQQAGAELATAKKDRKALETELNTAEGRVRELEARQVQPLPLTERQREMLVGVCGRKGIDGDPVHDAQAQLLAWAARHEERDKAREERKRREAGDEAAAKEAVQAALANERQVQEEIAAAEQRGREAGKREAARAQQEAEKREAASAARAEEQRLEALAAAQAADAARRADLLKNNPYAETPEGELRKGYLADVATIEMNKGILNRARKVWPESEEAIANAGERQKQRRAVAEAKGWDIGQPPRTPPGPNTQRDEGR